MFKSWRFTLAALVLPLAVLVGCAAIPTSGPVGSRQLSTTDTGQVFLVAEGPADGASPIEITQGFIRAQAAGVDDDYLVAKEYLTTQAAESWNPNEATTVYFGEPTLSVVSPSSVSTTYEEGDAIEVGGALDLAATVDESGQLVEAASDESQLISFSLVRVDDQWRISSAPAGTYISQPNFTVTYRRIALQFLSTDLKYLVPDIRWYPARNLAAHAVAGLVAGPAQWLRDAVTTAVPLGTTLQVTGAVQVSAEGVAQVDFSSHVLSAEVDQQELLMAQLNATLQQVPQVRTVKATSGNVDITTTAKSVLQDPATGADVAVVSDNQIQHIIDGKKVTDQSFTRIEEKSVSALALEPADGPSNGQFAVVRSGRRIVSVPRSLPQAAQSRVLMNGDDLAAPSIDRFGRVWSASGSDIFVVTQNGEFEKLSVSWLASSQIDAVRVSRDGARIVIASHADSSGRMQATVDIAAIVRDETGRPTQLKQGVTVAGSLDRVTEITWLQDSSIALISDSSVEGDELIYVVPVGDFSQVQPVVDGPRSLAADLGVRTLYVLQDDGSLFIRSATGASWTQVAQEVQAVAFPG